MVGFVVVPPHGAPCCRDDELFTCLSRAANLQHDRISQPTADRLAALLKAGTTSLQTSFHKICALFRIRQQIMSGDGGAGFSPCILEALCSAVGAGACWDFGQEFGPQSSGTFEEAVRFLDARLATLPPALQAEAASDIFVALSLDSLGNFFSEQACVAPNTGCTPS